MVREGKLEFSTRPFFILIELVVLYSMAQVIGSSGSLETLIQKFRMRGIWDFTAFQNFNDIYNQSRETMERIGRENFDYAYEVLQQNLNYFEGVRGEIQVINTLRTLPEGYYVLNEVMISFEKAIYWKKYGEYLKSAKIDHIVVGETGIFLIETKNWTSEHLKRSDFLPHKQIERANYLVYVQL